MKFHFHFISSPKMKFHFCQNDQYEIHTRNEFQMWMCIKYPTSLCLLILFWVSFVPMKISSRFEISFWWKWLIWNLFILPQFMRTQVKGWLNTKARFSTKMKSHSYFSSFSLSYEHTIRPSSCHLQEDTFSHQMLTILLLISDTRIIKIPAMNLGPKDTETSIVLSTSKLLIIQ